MIRDNSIGFSFASAYRRSVPATTIFTCRPPHPNRQAGLRCRYRSSHDSPLEGTGFEPSVPLLRKALLNVANRRRGHERQSHFQVQVRDCNACLERLPIACPFAEGPRVPIRLAPAPSQQRTVRQTPGVRADSRWTEGSNPLRSSAESESRILSHVLRCSVPPLRAAARLFSESF